MALGSAYNHLEPSVLSVLHILAIWPYHKTGLGVFIFQFSENNGSILIQLNCVWSCNNLDKCFKYDWHILSIDVATG